MPLDLSYLEGKRFCVVFLEDSDTVDPDKVKLRTMHGRASVDKQSTLRLEYDGGSIAVPSSSYPQILPSDGTDLLGDAEYYVIVKVSGMQL